MKRIISLTLCICLLFTLCACSSNQQDANETTTDKNTPNEATTAPVPQQNDYSVGNTVVLGQYEQDNNTSNGTEPIEWDVLAVENGKALLLSKHMLERKLYHDSFEEVTWETCSLRKWLNNDFYDTAFSRQEKNQICSVNNKNQDNLKYGTDGGNATDDNVFLLSTDEVDRYLDWSQVVNSGSYTAYLRDKSETNAAGNYSGWWWLRSAGQNQYFVLYCGTPDHDYEDIRYMGLDVMNPFANVRPAIWVSVDGKSTAENDKDPQNDSADASIKTSVSVGDLVYFGTYEQDNQNITKNEQIEWRILDIEDGKALLLSTYILDSMGFNSEYKSVTWENSTIRAWLNNDFYNSAFTSKEQSAIAKSQIINPNNPTWGTNGGNPTTDSVFLLSIQEAEKYFPNDDQNIITTATNYAYQQGCFMYEEYRTYNGVSYKQYCSWTVEPDPYPGLDGTFAYWWLRTPGEITTGNYGDIRIAYVKADEYPITHRGESIRTTLGVRPSIWIDLTLLSDSDLAKHEVTDDEKLAIETANIERINELISKIANGADYSAYAELYSLTSALKNGEKTLLDGKWCRKDGSFVGFSSPTAEDIAISLRCYNGMYQAQLNERARFINSSAAMLGIEASDGMAYILFVYDPAGAVRVYSLAGFGNGIEIPGVFIPERQYWDAYYSGNWPSIIDSDASVNDTLSKEPVDSSRVVGIYRYYKEIWDTGESTNIEEQREIGVVEGDGDLEIIELKPDGTGYVWFPFLDWIFGRECKYNFKWQFNAADNTATLLYSLQEGLDPINIRGYDTLVFNEEGLSVRVDIDQSTTYYIKD